MRIIVRTLKGYKLLSKEYPEAIIISKDLVAKELGVRDLGELKSIYEDDDIGLVKYVTSKFIIEVWR